MESQKHKVCRKCDKYLLASDFYKNKAVCKKCMSEQKKYYTKEKKVNFPKRTGKDTLRKKKK